jgi:hypothetical protein
MTDRQHTGRDNSGALFRVVEEDKKTDKWPDFKGDILVDGRKYWVSGWARTLEKTGKKYLSLALQPAYEANKPSPATKASAHAPDNDFLV